MPDKPTIETYENKHEAAWNEFVARSRNGTFIFDRRFMDYHANRFSDASFIFRQDGEIVALLPANRKGNELISHGGLTYGGMIVGQSATSIVMNSLFELLLSAAREKGITRLEYKAIPHIFHKSPAEEDLYALHQCGARLIRRDLSTAIAPLARIELRKGRRSMLARARKLADLVVGETEMWDEYWRLLAGTLSARHGAKPTHSVEEIRRLCGRFPEQIKLITGSIGGTVHAGVVLFLFDTAVHTQYMAADEVSRSHGVLDTILNDVAVSTCAAGKWLSFGISTEQQGRQLNSGLIDFKEAFGGRGIVHDFYELAI